MKYISCILIIIFFLNGYSQKQNNTLGSDIYVDIPVYVDLSVDSFIPVTVYVHESECNNCINYLNFVDIRLKSGMSHNWGEVLLFDTISLNHFMNFFTAYSVNNIAWNSQSFIDSKPINDNAHTILFTADTNMWIFPVPVVTIEKRYFYFTFKIPYATWSTYLDIDSVIDVHVYLSLDNAFDEEYWFRVFVRKNAYIKLPGWYRGDTHLHAIGTQNDAENGFPLEPTIIAAKKLGLDWFTCTDHSCDFDNYGLSPYQNWNLLKNKINQLNLMNNNFKVIAGIEASVLNSKGKVVHALVYPDPLHPYSLPYLFDGGGDLGATSVTLRMLYDSLKWYNGFCYAAHPFAEGDKLPDIINGGCWNVKDNLLPQNGQPANSVGNVIWNDVYANSDVYQLNDSCILFYPLMGFQNLNLSNSLICYDTERDPWNTNYQSEPFGFYALSESNYKHPMYRLKQNMEAYDAILIRSLRRKNLMPNYWKHWKAFLIAGSDAHGSFNYSSTDFIYGGIFGQMEDNHPGAFSTLIFAPQGMGAKGENILYALKNGHCLLSEGPILNMFLISNYDTTIVGDDTEIALNNLQLSKLHFDLKTNYYYGNSDKLIIYLYTRDTVYKYETYPTNSQLEINLITLFQLFDVPLMLNQYYAIRAEWYCLKQYNLLEQILNRRSEKRYIALTNPIWFNVRNTTQLESLSDNEIMVYPNPVSDKCIVQMLSNDKVQSIFLTDATQKKIYPSYAILTNNYIELDLKNITKGVYVLSMLTDKTLYSIKIIKE